jgi:hypothetical protein
MGGVAELATRAAAALSEAGEMITRSVLSLLHVVERRSIRIAAESSPGAT